MPYRVDFDRADDRALERLIDLGALDVDCTDDGRGAALLPDTVPAHHVAAALGNRVVERSQARGRDADSVWILRPRAIRLGRLRIVPAGAGIPLSPGDLVLTDTAAFGTGLHPTTRLCVELLDELCETRLPDRVLDVGTGSGVLALTALSLGVAHATAIDIDQQAVAAAGENARLNQFRERLDLVRGGPEQLSGTWPLVVANVLAAPLIQMAPELARRVGHLGRLIVSGIPAGLEPEVERAYRHAGMGRAGVRARDGWVALVLQASW